MEKKMTSGEIARKAGVSQKAIRLYDEKGLLKPTDYSEGNYRLYDKAALQILEKIVALKKIGFSLEDIRDNLAAGEAQDIEAALRMQLKEMEDKRYQMDKVIAAIRGTLERKTEYLDWDDVAEIVQCISLDQGADENHWDALKHTEQEMDWYVKIYQSLNIHENEKILDLGCGYAKLWRNNWTEIPKGTKIYGIDVHGSWADDFEKYIPQHKAELNDGVEISLDFLDIEGKEAWDKIQTEREYSLIIAHYLQSQLKNPEAMVAHCSKVLSKSGVFSINCSGVSTWHYYFKNVLEEIGLKAAFIQEIIEAKMEKGDADVTMLNKYFKKVEAVVLTNTWHYTDEKELFQKMKTMYANHEKYICKNEEKIIAYFDKKIKEDGEIEVVIESPFWHCSHK